MQEEHGIANLLTTKDKSNKPIFILADGRSLAFKHEILPYWSKLCDELFDSASEEAR